MRPGNFNGYAIRFQFLAGGLVPFGSNGGNGVRGRELVGVSRLAQFFDLC